MQFIESPNNFYLGARVDPDTHEVREDDVVYYDSRDLTTHGVILGMTGSGKTGLGIGMLEEAVMDGIPSIIIDPKGDITNMLLAFPDLTPEHFRGWVNPEDAARANHTIEQHATSEAEKWKNGLAEWGMTNDRVQAYRRAARFSIYTPGSEAGLQVSILQSLAAPRDGWAGNEEFLREKIAGTVTAILALVGINAKPVEDREHILIANIFEYNWRNGTDLSMEQLIIQVQKPPFTKLGVLEVESVFPEKDRFKLAQLLNNIIAAPNFQNWIQGEPIDIPTFLYTPEGYPRTTIFYIAHLTDSERQFIMTLLLEGFMAWMRTLSGSTSLRALLYIDEVFGMFPPTRNPPTKGPIMRLLKQARAFGIGILVATQNPKDIDYKGLSNAGTWLIGKLQTDNDKDRVLEGLDSARDATSALDVRKVEALLGRLGPREFIMHNVHEPDTPILMSSRWTMSYLRGPLTRQQINQLMANQRDLQSSAPRQAYPAFLPVSHEAAPSPPVQTQAGVEQPAQAPAPEPAAAPAGPTYSGRPEAVAPPRSAEPPAPKKKKEEEPPPGFSAIAPVLPSSIYQYYLPTEYTVEQAVRNWETMTSQPAVQVETHKRLLYRPSLLAQVNVRFNHKATNNIQDYTYAFVVPTLPHVPLINWLEYQSEPFDPHSLDPSPFAEAFYAEIPSTMATGSGFRDLEKHLVDWISRNAWLEVYYNPVLKIYSSLDETKRDFQSKVQAICRQERDKEIDQVANRFDNRLAHLEGRAETMTARRQQKADELSARKQEEMISVGEDALQMFRGNAGRMLSRITRLRRYTATTEDYVGVYDKRVQDIQQQYAMLQQDMERTLQAVQDKWVDVVQQIEEVRVAPYKKDIVPTLFGLGWVPYWDVAINGSAVILPASSSGLTQAQGAYGQY
ncbi:MAG: DUF87 domain-containing protein [Anaerolineae bacterium]|nr:DUF87 domain-containing protein [Anaerolineae bacterium]